MNVATKKSYVLIKDCSPTLDGYKMLVEPGAASISNRAEWMASMMSTRVLNASFTTHLYTDVDDRARGLGDRHGKYFEFEMQTNGAFWEVRYELSRIYGMPGDNYQDVAYAGGVPTGQTRELRAHIRNIVILPPEEFLSTYGFAVQGLRIRAEAERKLGKFYREPWLELRRQLAIPPQKLSTHVTPTIIQGT